MPKMIAPGTGNAYVVADGTVFIPASDGTVDAPAAYVPQLVAMGFVLVNDTPVDTTTGRPVAGLTPGMMFFDSTAGRPIWRNATNTGWVFSDGTAA